jgi:DNA-binding NtrC family response regulator
MTTRTDILIIDDDASLGEMLALHADELGLKATAVQTGADLKALMANMTAPRLVLVDQHLPDTNGLALIPQLRDRFPETPVVMMTGKHDMTLAISAIRAGAADYLHKPIDIDQLDAVISKILTQETATNTKAVAAPHLASSTDIIGTSRAILDVYKGIAIASQSDVTVLISGESGTGKELVARAIHHHRGKGGLFLPVNCSTIVDTLLESEMFGHEKGAFTGAVARKDGKFTLARGGTLFLDEIGEMSPNLQAKLLRVLQEHTFEHVGGTEVLHTDARIIAATHRNLPKMIENGTFREDLFYRLKVIHIHLPPLRDRLEDLPQLVSHLLARANASLGKNAAGLTEAAFLKLRTHSWPGNVRELENTLTRAVAMAQSPVLTPDLLNLTAGALTTGPADTAPPTQTLDNVEKDYIQKVLFATKGHRGQSCAILGISRPALDRKIRKYNLEDPKK